MDNQRVCDKFQPTILEGQLCYTIDIAKIAKNAGQRTQLGKSNGLRLLLDPDPLPLSAAGNVNRNFKVFIHTLAQYTAFGPGYYGMSSLKKMTATAGFKQLPDHQKGCLIHNREECQTQKYMEHVNGECKCTPWALKNNQVKIKNIAHAVSGRALIF